MREREIVERGRIKNAHLQKREKQYKLTYDRIILKGGQQGRSSGNKESEKL